MTTPITLGVNGMTCTNCALSVQKYLEKKELANVAVSFPNAEASFDLNGALPLSAIVEGIENLGFKVVEETEEEGGNVEEHKGWSAIEWKLLICSILTLPLILSMFLPYPILKNPNVQILLCWPVFLIGFHHFGKSAWHSLKAGVPNMDVLIFIGSTAAFTYSLVGYMLELGHDFLFWETAASIITLVLLGNVLEHRSVRRTTSAIRALYELRPATANKVIVDEDTGIEQTVEVVTAEIKKGDVFLVATGDRIPVDGKVVWGSGAADEAMMTGESLLVDKNEGTKVIGGTILELGTIKVEAEKIGKETTLSQIIQMVKSAQAKQPPIQRLADKISAVFVPIVLGIAALTFLLAYFAFGISLQQALMNSIAVLVISCPCAMGLATPTALVVGLGRAAKSGVLIKGGTTLETLAEAQHIVFDKTGTLTTGAFSMDNYWTELPHHSFKSIVLGLERYSTHPLAKSLVRSLEVEVKPYELSEIRELKGLGIMGKDEDGNTFMAGSHKIAIDLTDDDQHNIYILRNGRLVGWLDMGDTLRPDAVQCVQYLNNRNLDTILLSGDQEEKTEYVARKIGMQEYHANKLPQEKLAIIQGLKEKGTTVMVGDGINDAPALTEASVGISLSSASQIAIESADVVLLNSNLRSINEAVGISKQTVLTIKQNLFWAFFYNIIAIPIAAVGLLNPMIAAAAMAFSDIIVIGNSLRLKNKKI